MSVNVLDIAGTRIAPGERRNLWLSLGHRPDGTAQGIPLMVVHGALPGPCLGITAGIHGDVCEGPEGLRRFMASLNPATLRGTVIASPQANPLAYEVFNRVGYVDSLDLNRCFPGRPDGSITQRIAHLLVQEIVERVDYLVDIHGGGLPFDFVPFVGFNSAPGPVGEASFALAKAFGLPYLHGSVPFANVFRLEAAKRDIPAILVEIGGGGWLNPDLLAVVEGSLLNVARHIGLVEGAPDLLAHYQVTKSAPAGDFQLAPTGGFMLTCVRLGDQVAEGQLVATLVDVFGSDLARIQAAAGGVVMGLRTIPVTRAGEWVYAILPVVAEAGPETPLADITGALQS